MFIPGAPSFAEPIQGTIAHIIMLNFARRMKELPVGQTNAMILLNLRIEIQLFNDQMRYPWGQLVMMENNALNSKPINQYYAIKSLSNVVKIINKENFVKIMIKTDADFNLLWQRAITEVNKFYTEIRELEILNLTHLTASTVTLFNRLKGKEDYLNESLMKAITQVKIAWQSIWAKFKATKKAFEYVLSDKNGNFDIKLSNTKPFIQDEILIILACNNNNEIRLWARSSVNLFKARVSTRQLKWVDTEKFHTNSNPAWWLYAIKKIDLDQEENTYANISRPDTITTDY